MGFNEKSPAMQEFIAKLTGKSVNEFKSGKKCTFCGKKVQVEEFRDKLSAKEWTISRLCQKCQDSVFGVNDVPIDLGKFFSVVRGIR